MSDVTEAKDAVCVQIKAAVRADADTLWQIMTDNVNYAWRSDIARVEILDETNFVEYDKKNFPTFFTVIEAKPTARYVMKFENKNITGSFTGILREEEGGATVTLKECVRVKRLFLRLLIKPYLKKQQKKYVAALKREAERCELNSF